MQEVTCELVPDASPAMLGGSRASVSFASVHRNDPRSIPKTLVNRIRMAYFQNASLEAGRYRIGLEDVMAHLERVQLGRLTTPGRILTHISDITQAVACCKGSHLAWADLHSEYESILTNACLLRLDATEAALFTRRFMLDLERNSRLGHRDLQPTMMSYAGTRPMRMWLTDRLLGRLETTLQGRQGLTREQPRRPEDGSCMQAVTGLRLAD